MLNKAHSFTHWRVLLEDRVCSRGVWCWCEMFACVCVSAAAARSVLRCIADAELPRLRATNKYTNMIFIDIRTARFVEYTSLDGYVKLQLNNGMSVCGWWISHLSLVDKLVGIHVGRSNQHQRVRAVVYCVCICWGQILHKPDIECQMQWNGKHFVKC